MADTNTVLSLRIEFGGGLELLFSNQRQHKLTIPALVQSTKSTSSSSEATGPDLATRPADMAFLILYLRDHLLTERAELFVEEGTVSVIASPSRLLGSLLLTE
jgi:ubiquitin related modifier 1